MIIMNEVTKEDREKFAQVQLKSFDEKIEALRRLYYREVDDNQLNQTIRASQAKLISSYEPNTTQFEGCDHCLDEKPIGNMSWKWWIKKVDGGHLLCVDLGRDYLQLAIVFCPFCGSKLEAKE